LQRSRETVTCTTKPIKKIAFILCIKNKTFWLPKKFLVPKFSGFYVFRVFTCLRRNVTEIGFLCFFLLKIQFRQKRGIWYRKSGVLWCAEKFNSPKKCIRRKISEYFGKKELSKEKYYWLKIYGNLKKKLDKFF